MHGGLRDLHHNQPWPSMAPCESAMRRRPVTAVYPPYGFPWGKPLSFDQGIGLLSAPKRVSCRLREIGASRRCVLGRLQRRPSNPSPRSRMNWALAR